MLSMPRKCSCFATPTHVPMDRQQWPPTYPDDDGFTMIEMPFQGSDIAMVVIAPRKPGGLPRLEARLDARSENASPYSRIAKATSAAGSGPKYL